MKLTQSLAAVVRALAPVVCPGPDTEELADAIVREVELFAESIPAHFALGLQAGFAALEAAPLATRRRRFSQLDLEARKAVFARFARAALTRDGAKIMKGVIGLSYYELPAVQERIGYRPAAYIAEAARRRLAKYGDDIRRHEALVIAPARPAPPAAGTEQPANLFTAESWPDVAGVTRTGDAYTLDCDVVVIGSGAGGAVVAAELAEAGVDVVILEEGGYHPTSSFDARAAHQLRTLYRDGGAQLALGRPPITFAEGRCVGGSTTINGGMSWRTPERVLERWRDHEAMADMSPASMEPHFARVEQFISARKQDPGTIGRDNELLREGAARLGWRTVDNIRNANHCAGTNNCAFGCPTGAKQSTLVSYVPRALAFGARLYADCRVDRIVFRGKRAVGVSARVGGRDVTVRARRAVVTSCGAIQTPALLLRSGFRSPSGRLGHDLTMHPNVKVVAVFDEAVKGWQGVHQAYQVRHFQDEGFLMAAVNLPPGLLALSLPHYGAELRDLLADYDRLVVAGALVEDTITGRVRSGPGGRAITTYQLTDEDIGRLVRGASLVAQTMFAAGARRVVLPFEEEPDLRSMDDALALANRRVSRHMEVTTVHMMGTARMGGDPMRHVCDPYGAVHEARGLYVADASLFPSAIGVNPMETIMGLATRVAGRMLDRGVRETQRRAA